MKRNTQRKKIKMLEEIDKTLQKSDKLRGLKRKAYRCRFYEYYLEVVARRCLELNREAGPYQEAVLQTHEPKAAERLKLLRRLLDNIQVFSGEKYDLDPEENAFRQDALDLIERFTIKVVNVLLQGAQKSGSSAKSAVKKALEECQVLTQESFTKLQKSLQDVEVAVCDEAIVKGDPKSEVLAVLSLDLAQYGMHIDSLDQYLRAPGVFGMNREIATLIERGVASAKIPSDRFLMLDTGDGALMLFKASDTETSAKLAIRFSKCFYSEVKNSNESKDDNCKLHFRIGVSTGELVLSETRLRTGEILTFNFGGRTIGTSVRLQSAAKTGEILACQSTYTQINDEELSRGFLDAENVMGKSHEKRVILARRCRVLDPFSEEQTTRFSRID